MQVVFGDLKHSSNIPAPQWEITNSDSNIILSRTINLCISILILSLFNLSGEYVPL